MTLSQVVANHSYIIQPDILALQHKVDGRYCLTKTGTTDVLGAKSCSKRRDIRYLLDILGHCFHKCCYKSTVD